MKIISWNLLHSSGASLDEVEQLIAAEHPDLLLLQEATQLIDLLPRHLGGHYSRQVLPGRRHGLAAWSRLPFSAAPRYLRLQPGLMVRRICQIIDLGEFTVANVHLSHGQMLNRRQLRLIAENLPARAAVLGDFNLVGPPLLKKFRDVGPRMTTHHAGNILPLRLDRCLVRDLNCTQARILPKGGSDHHPIMVHLAIPAPPYSGGT